jgi:quercetin dioxygenase-like cupin family protein
VTVIKTVYEIVSDGEKSLLREREIELTTAADVVPGNVLHLAELDLGAGGLAAFSPGYVGDFHNAPSPLWMFVLSGRMEIELSDGVTVLLEPGDIVNYLDTDGVGHASKLIGEEPFLVANLVVEPTNKQ